MAEQMVKENALIAYVETILRLRKMFINFKFLTEKVIERYFLYTENFLTPSLRKPYFAKLKVKIYLRWIIFYTHYQYSE